MTLTTPFKTICFVGLGYIGLPTAAVLAGTGTRVIGLDVNAKVVETINRGEIHIVEPGLAELVKEVVQSGHLRATTVAEPADAFVIAVPTPFKGDHEPDISYIESACKSIAPMLKKGDLVILESTSPVGTTETLAQELAKARPDLRFPRANDEEPDIRVAYCPERVLPGQVIRELVSNDRVIGGLTPACAERAAELYRLFVNGECVVSDARTAEMCKLTENSFRDVNIAFANELSIICERLQIDVWKLISLANRHPRVNILTPGAGVGGHCIAVDPWFIVSAAPNQSRLIRQARMVNDQKPAWVIDQVRHKAKLVKKSDPTIALFGLAFKPNIDDFRESPALEIALSVCEHFPQRTIISEPHADAIIKSMFPAVPFVEAHYAIESADLVVMLVAHDSFRELDWSLLREKCIVDACGVFRDKM